MSEHLPVVEGGRLVRALLRAGWIVLRARGSHVRLRRGTVRISVPVHAGRVLPRGTLAAILSDAEMSADELRALL